MATQKDFEELNILEQELSVTQEKTKVGNLLAQLWTLLRRFSRGEIRELILTKVVEAVAKITGVMNKLEVQEKKIADLLDTVEELKKDIKPKK